MKTSRLFGTLLGMVLSIGILKGAWAADPIPLEQVTHIHGMAVNPSNTTQLYLATHHGLYLAFPDGTGASVPADDKIVEGESELNESH